MTDSEARDPQRVLDDLPMNWRQYVVVALMVALNALDGFDVLSSAFASPGISKAWGVPREALGIMLSAELVGMGFGSVLLGGLADKRGRKPTMLACLVIMAIGMYFAHASNSVTELSVWRFITGLGIGGMLTATNAVTAESTSKSARNIAMAIYVIGYPLGGVIGGLVAQTWLLPNYDWRAVFLFGAVVTAAIGAVRIVVVMPRSDGMDAAAAIDSVAVGLVVKAVRRREPKVRSSARRPSRPRPRWWMARCPAGSILRVMAASCVAPSTAICPTRPIRSCRRRWCACISSVVATSSTPRTAEIRAVVRSSSKCSSSTTARPSCSRSAPTSIRSRPAIPTGS